MGLAIHLPHWQLVRKGDCPREQGPHYGSSGALPWLQPGPGTSRGVSRLGDQSADSETMALSRCNPCTGPNGSSRSWIALSLLVASPASLCDAARQVAAGHGRSRQVTAGRGRSRQVAAGHGRSRQVTAGHSRSRQVTAGQSRSRQVTAGQIGRAHV